MSSQSEKIAGIHALTALQEGMLALAIDANGADGDPYVIQTWGTLRGLTDATHFEAAWQALVQRHAALRSAFVFQGQVQPRQVVLREALAAIHVEDCRELAEAAQQEHLDAWCAQDLHTGFSMTRPPLARIALFRTSSDTWYFLLTHHHLILDGWSVAILFAELQQLLAGHALTTTAVGPEVLAPRTASATHAASDPFWRTMLAPWNPPDLGDTTRTGPAETGASRLHQTVPASNVNALRETARRLGVTPAAVTAAAWLLTLCRGSGQRRVTIGVTTSGRADDAASQGAVGMFVNTLPLCIELRTGETLDAFVQRVASLWRGLVERDQADAAALRPLTGASAGQPLFDALIAFENFPQTPTQATGVQIQAQGSHERTNLAAALIVIPEPQQWRLELQIEHTRLMPAQATHLLVLLKQSIELFTLPGTVALDQAWMRLGEGRTVRALVPSLLPASTPSDLLAWWNANLQASPDSVATRDGMRTLTRMQLDHLSRRCAAALAQHGVRAGDRVALCMERSDTLLAMMLGVLRAGACYVPIDPHQGSSRRAQVIADSAPACIVSDAALANDGDLVAQALLDAVPNALAWLDRPMHPLAPAYIIYTSGSTGAPKGVMVSHRNVVALIAACQQRMDLGSRDVWSFLHSFAFDFSVWEIWGAWLTGGSVLVVPYTVSRDPLQFVALCQAESVTVLSQTPSAFKGFEQSERLLASSLKCLRYVVFGGEPVMLGSLRRWTQRHGDQQPSLINMYGITETTVHVSFCRLDTATINSDGVAPIGGPLAHLGMKSERTGGLTSLTGQPGEILVSGRGVALGYFNQARLTAERFVPDPQALAPGERAYRSGDLVVVDAGEQWRPHGRADRQVKLRGFRIEPGEIENALSGLDDVAACAVHAIPKSTGSEVDLSLCAWVVPRPDASIDTEALLRALRALVPPHMLPERISYIAVLPLTGSGKIDISRLPNPWLAASDTANQDGNSNGLGDSIADPLTSALCEAWQEALGVAQVRPSDAFFAIGGDSVRSLKVTSTCRARGLQFPLGKLLENPTPASLAVWIRAQMTEPATIAQAAEPSPSLPAPFAFLAPAVYDSLPADLLDAWPATRLQIGMLFYAGYGDNMALYEDLFTWRLSLETTPARLTHAMARLCQRHPVLRSRFQQIGDDLLQVLPATKPVGLTLHDLRGLSALESEQRVVAINRALARRPVDPFAGPLFHAVACELDEGQWHIALLFHHAIIDGWSLSLLTAEWFALSRMTAPVDDADADADATRARADAAAQALHAEAERHALTNDALRQRWTDRLGTEPPSRLWRWPAAAGQAMPSQGKATLVVSSDTLRRLRAHADTGGVHLKHFLLGIYGVVAAWAQGAQAVPIGVVMNGRPDVEGADQAVGMFLNTLPIKLAGRGSWLALAKAAAQAERAVFADRTMPLAEVQRLVGGPSFEMSFNFVHFHSRQAMVGAGAAAAMEEAREHNSLSIAVTFGVSPDGQTLSGQIQHGEPMTATQLQWLVQCLEQALDQAATAPHAEADLRDPLAPWPGLPLPLPLPVGQIAESWEPVHETVLRRLRAAPGAVILIDAYGVPLLAEELLTLHGRYVAHLRAMTRLLGRPCALHLPRSPELIAAILAAASCGAWTVYLDTGMPLARQTAVLAALDDPVVLHHSDLEEVAPQLSATTIDLAQAWDAEEADHTADGSIASLLVPPQAIAYSIFTSGSTGSPKGVALTHGALAAHMTWFNQAFGFGPGDRILYRTRPTFDASVWELWAPLMTGALLVIASDDAMSDPQYIAEIVARHRITALQLVPTLLDAMTDQASLQQLSGLRYLFLGGEALKRDLVLHTMTALPALCVVNLYGPTETAIQVCTDMAQADAPDTGNIWPIGRPVDATHAVVVDEHLQPLPTGAEGELLIGGAQVGQGYLGLPRMTSQRFVPDPFGAPGSRAFLTGDRVRRLPDGRLSYLGRSDDQVKIAGNRIELGEIEAVLAQALSGGQRSAAGVWAQDDVEQLVGYVEWPAGQPGFDDTARAARNHLEHLLPRYMVPARFLPVPIWPLLSSGKTDRKALYQAGMNAVVPVEVMAMQQQPAHDHSATLTGLVQRLLGTLLGKDVVAGDDFFDIGGDSIVAMQLVARLRANGFSVTPRQIFELRRIEPIAAQLRPLATTRAALYEPASGHLKPLPAQQWFARLALRQPGWWNQVVSLRFVRHVTGPALGVHLNTLGQHHRVLGLRLAVDGRWGEGDTRPQVESWAVDNVPQEMIISQRIARMSLLQNSLDLQAGPIWGVLLELDAHGAVRQAHIAIHHLAVDGYSWRLLFTQINQLLAGQTIDASGPSAMAVAAALPLTGDSAAMAHWREHARRMAAMSASPARTRGRESATQTCHLALSPAISSLLLQRCERDWHLSAEAMLGGVLLYALGQLDQNVTVDLAIEHHGRDAADVAELGTERTLGWFTSLHPLLVMPGENLLDCLREFKRAHLIAVSQPTDWLRACMHDAALAASPAPTIVLNYLGSFDNSFDADSHFVAGTDDLGPAIGPDNTRTSALDLVALVEGGQLRVNLSADSLGRWGAHVESLMQTLEAGLQRLAESGDGMAASALWLPQDFKADLDDASLQALLAGDTGLQDILPVTPTQHGMLFTHQRHGGGEGTHVQQVEFQMSKDVDPNGIRASFEALVQRHETLRTAVVVTPSGEAVQLVYAQAQMPLTVLDLSTEADPAAHWQEFVAKDARQGFDLACPPLSRVTLARLGPASLRVLWTHHHLVLDGWSLPILLEELAAPAQVLVERAKATPRTPFWHWLRDGATVPARERQRKWWRQRFTGFTAPDRIQSVTRADDAPGSAAPAIEFSLPTQQWLALKKQAQAAGITASTLTQAAWGLLLSRLLRTRDLAIGVTVSGRPPELAGAAQWVGMFINTLPLRVTVQPALPARSWLQALQTQAVELQANCQDSLADIPRWIGVDHLIDTVVVFLNYPPGSSDGTDSDLAKPDRVVTRERNEYPVSLYAVDAASLQMTLRFDPQVVDRALAGVLAEGVTQILATWAKDITLPVGATPFMSRQRFDALLARGSNADKVSPPVLIERIVAQARLRNDAVALVWSDGQTLSYGGLLRRSESLALLLHTHHGCGPETLVAIAGHREPETVIALLAVMWCGAAFLPLDPDQPLARLTMICEDARPALLLGLPAVLDRLAPLGLIGLALDIQTTDTGIEATHNASVPFRPAPRHPLDLAYMLFTSGSTGRPKGVGVCTNALSNAILSMCNRPGIGVGDTLASVTTISFDIALLEILAPLAVGARLRLVDPHTARDGRALCRLLQTETVTVLQATPATWKLLREAGLQAPALRSWCGGEALRTDLADWLHNYTAEVWNLYGPTETTIWSSVGRLDGTGVHVGQAIAQTTLCLVDDDLTMTLDGAIGEVAIAGDGVSRGYAGQAARTARQFVPAVDGSGERMYLTGDLGRWHSDGRLEILGRIDRQLKIQGFRIEPEEIEQALLGEPGVGDAVAAVVPAASVGETGEPVLLAWVVAARGAALDLQALRMQLQRRLPSYMVPAQVLTLSAMPHTPNRKVDVAALPLPASLRAAANVSFTPHGKIGSEPPDEPLTRVVALLMARVLGLEHAVGAHDDFFSLGGQSLLAMQLRTLLERFTCLDVDLRLIFDLRTPARMAQGLSQLTGGAGLTQLASDTLKNMTAPTDHST